MCSYNQINGSYTCQNSKTINGLLKGELGFQGFVVSDWDAQHSGLASAQAGLDMAMPSSTYWENGNLSLMVSNGSLPQSHLDDMATRILASWYRYAQVEDPGFGMPVDLLAPHDYVDVRDNTSNELVLQAAIEGHVPVKNTNSALPLKKPKVLSLFGHDGVACTRNAPAPPGFSLWAFGLQGAQTILGLGDFNATYMLEVFLSSQPWNAAVPGIALNGSLISGGGSGTVTPAYVDAPFNAFEGQAKSDGTFLTWDFYSQDPDVNGASDACIVFVNALASEGWDRPNIADSYSDTLVKNVASKCANTHVIVHNAGIRLVDRWIDNPNVTAVIYAHLPGQDGGQALVDVMYGKQSPSRRLPYTVAKKASDYGELLGPAVPTNTTEWHVQSNFTEGVYIDYRHFIAQNITPRYEFGFGLTYTTFSYFELHTSVSNETSMSYKSSNGTANAEGGDPELWQTVMEVSCKITNIGEVATTEVAQLYVGIPGSPEKVLRGFEKHSLTPGESCIVHFKLTRRDLSTWDVVSQKWVLQSGDYNIYVGKSVLDIQLQGKTTLRDE